MRTPLLNDADFIRSLRPTQRDYFLLRESARHTRLQSTLRDLSRGLSTVSELSGETQVIVLDHSVASRR